MSTCRSATGAKECTAPAKWRAEGGQLTCGRHMHNYRTVIHLVTGEIRHWGQPRALEGFGVIKIESGT